MKIIFSILFVIVNLTLMQSQTTPHAMDLIQLGIRFTIPAGWTGQELEDKIVLGHTSIPGLLVLFSNAAETSKALKNGAMEPIVDEGLYLSPDGTFTIDTLNRVEGYYTGSYLGTSVKAYGLGLVNDIGKVGMSILILTETDKFTEQHISEVKKLAETVTFYKVKAPDKTVFWTNRIVGRQLKYMYTSSSSDYIGGSSGISDVTIINLCSDGSFNYYSNSHASFDSNAGFGHVNSNENTRGSYRIYAKDSHTILELQFLSGKKHEYQLTVNSKQNTLLNGTRYFITTLEGCN